MAAPIEYDALVVLESGAQAELAHVTQSDIREGGVLALGCVDGQAVYFRTWSSCAIKPMEGTT